MPDVSDQPLQNGRIYSFSLPSSCGSQCSAPYTQVPYTTSAGTGPSASPSASASQSPSPSASPSSSPSASPSQSSGSGSGCSVTASVTGSWGSGYQLAFTVTDSGTAAISGWTVHIGFAGSQTVANSWNAAVTQSGQNVSAASVGYNGSLSPGGSTSWGMVVNGPNQPLTGLSCTEQ